MIRNLFEDIAKSAAKVTAAQQKSLSSLNKVVLDNKIALDYLSAEYGDACGVTNTTH